MRAIRRLHVPLRRAEDVIPHLGAVHHWKEGRSAKSLVDQWWWANDLPARVRALLEQAPEWRGAELVDAFVERCTDLADGRPAASQTDLLALVASGDRLGVVAIEAKVDEGFDRTVGEWLADGSAGKAARLARLCDLLALDPASVQHLRYQLFHRAAAAVIEAKRYRSRQSAMIVQSWSPADDGFDDYAAFFRAVGNAPIAPGTLGPAIELAGVAFRTAWSREC